MGWMDLIDNKLEKLFNSKPDNSEAVAKRRREGVVKGIDAALAAHKKGEAKGPRGWYTKKGDVARFSLRSGTKIVPLGGKDFNHCPAERLGDVYSDLRKDVAAGKHDNDIAAAWENSRRVGSADGTRRLSARAGKPMDPEKVYQRNVARYGQARADELRARAR